MSYTHVQYTGHHMLNALSITLSNTAKLYTQVRNQTVVALRKIWRMQRNSGEILSIKKKPSMKVPSIFPKLFHDRKNLLFMNYIQTYQSNLEDKQDLLQTTSIILDSKSTRQIKITSLQRIKTQY